MLNEDNSLSLARRSLPAFGYDPDEVSLSFVKLRENCVFRADAPDHSFALRLHRPGYRTPTEIDAESDFIRVLAARGFPVVTLLPTLSGSYTTTVREGDLDVVVDAQLWVEGAEPLGSSHDGDGGGENAGLQEEHFVEMGALAARLHTLAEELHAEQSFPRTPWDAEGILGEGALWGDALTVPTLTPSGARVLLRARRRIMQILDEYGTDPTVFGAIHADFTPENILVSGSDLVIIDFDDFGNGWYLFDLATALFFLQGHPEYRQFRSGLIRGYRAQRDLDPREANDLLDVFLVARGFTYLGWAATRPGTEAAEFVVEEVLPLVLQMAEDLESRLAGTAD